MHYLPFWAGGLALAAVVLLHYAVLHVQMGVSGRITTLVNRFRAKRQHEPELSDEDMLAALRAMTEAEFGADSVGEMSAPAPAPVVPTTLPTSSHLLFLGGLVIGGAISAASVGGFQLTPTLQGELFARFAENPVLAYSMLFGGGMLAGLGTRMAGGCTSGHGLVGVPLLERGSLVATASFFGAGIAVSVLMEVLR